VEFAPLHDKIKAAIEAGVETADPLSQSTPTIMAITPAATNRLPRRRDGGGP